MSAFEDWFKRHEGVPPAACAWLHTFLNSLDPYEVLPIFELHQDTLVTNEMIDELDGSYQIMASRRGDISTLMIRGLILDRIELIRDAQAYGVAAAVTKYQTHYARLDTQPDMSSVRDIDVLLADMHALMLQRQFTEAISIGPTLMAKLATSTPDNRALVLYNMGVCYNELGQYVEAEACYERSISENPDDTDTWYNRVVNQVNWAMTARRIGESTAYGMHFRDASRLLIEARLHGMNAADSAKLHEILDSL